MLEQTRFAVYATASLVGNIHPAIPHELDASRRLSHFDCLRVVLPKVATDTEAPIRLLVSAWLDLIKRGVSRGEREQAVDLLSALFNCMQAASMIVPEAVVGSSLVALLEVAMGFAVEPRPFVVKCIHAFVDILIIMHRFVDENKLVGMMERVKVVNVPEMVGAVKKVFTTDLPESVLLAAIDIVCRHSNEPIVMPPNLIKTRFEEYMKNTNLYNTELLYLGQYIFSPNTPEYDKICDHFIGILSEANLEESGLVVAFDSSNLSSIDYILDRKVECKFHDIEFGQNDITAVCKLFNRRTLLLDRFQDLISENRFNLTKVLQYSRAYLGLKGFDSQFVGQLLFELDDVVECSRNQNYIYSYLKIINVLIQNSSSEANCFGMLVLLLPKLIHDDHHVRQLASDNLSLLCHQTKHSSLRSLIDEYRELLVDSCKEQFESPHLYPMAPRLLSAILHSSKDSIDNVWSSVMFLDELLEQKRFNLDNQYLSSLVDLMTTFVIIASDSEQIILPKPRVQTISDTVEESNEPESVKTMNDMIVEKSFEAAYNLLSSDFGSVKKNSLILLERCCEYFKEHSAEKDNFLPFIHKMWNLLWSRISDADQRVCNRACTTIAMITSFDPGFCKGRLKEKGTLERLYQSRADPDKIVMLLTRVIEAGLELELRVVEQAIMRYPVMVPMLLDTCYGDIAWYHLKYIG